jgi:hypothetical protein
LVAGVVVRSRGEDLMENKTNCIIVRTAGPSELVLEWVKLNHIRCSCKILCAVTSSFPPQFFSRAVQNVSHSQRHNVFESLPLRTCRYVNQEFSFNRTWLE